MSHTLLTGLFNGLKPTTISVVWCKPYAEGAYPSLLRNLRHSHAINIFFPNADLLHVSMGDCLGEEEERRGKGGDAESFWRWGGARRRAPVQRAGAAAAAAAVPVAAPRAWPSRADQLCVACFASLCCRTRRTRR